MKKVLAGVAIVTFSAFGLSDALAATVKVLVIGGGGAGGMQNSGGRPGAGGGAGGYQYDASHTVNVTTYPVVVGAGGTSATPSSSSNDGGASSFDTITANGGGGGGNYTNEGYQAGRSGGCGGGATGVSSSYGSGNQGYHGGTSGNNGFAGGGGGTGEVGGNGSGGSSGNGGGGTSNSITGSAVYYGGGGGGGGWAGTYGSGGNGGGGDGSHTASANGNPGIDGLGGGGGGAGPTGTHTGGAGGKGVVIIAYHSDGSDGISPASTGGTITQSGGYQIHTFTSNGTFTVLIPTPTPTNTPTQTPTNTPTITPTVTPTYTPTVTPTDTPTQTPTDTPTVTPTPTPTQTPTCTNTPDVVPPDAPVITGVSHNMSGQMTEVKGTAEAHAAVYVYEGGTILGSTTADGSGDWIDIPGTPIVAGPHSISAKAEDAFHNLSAASSFYGLSSPVNTVNGFQDAVTIHSGAASMRIEKAGLCEFRLAVDASVPMTVKCWMRENGAYAGTQPAITLTGLGIDGTGEATASMTVGADTWEQLTVAGTPNAKGVATLKVETFSTADGSKAWVDDISVAQ